ncbi:MAG: D-amino-acid transaminase [Pseudomonadota bacterium]
MSKYVYVNGTIVAEADAKISVYDRGFLFGDGVYEVSTVLGGRLVDNAAHLARLERSLKELRIPAPLPLNDIPALQTKLIEMNALDEGVLYLQISRGAADRDFGFPANAAPSLVMFTQQKTLIHNPAATKGLKVISIADLRWRRRDIKSVNLLAPVLAKQAAKDAGVDDAWMHEDGLVTEGSSNNAYILTKDDVIVTRNLGHHILSGITRRAVLALANEEGLTIEERGFTLDEAYAAKEAFITSASTFVLPVVSIDGHGIGSGAPGPIAAKMRKRYIAFARARFT